MNNKLEKLLDNTSWEILKILQKIIQQLMKIQHLFIILFLLSQYFSNAQINKIDSIINALHDNNQFDGTILVAHQNKVVYQKAIGTANRSWNIPISMKQGLMDIRRLPVNKVY